MSLRITAFSCASLLALQLIQLCPTRAQEETADPEGEEPSAPPVYEGDVLYLKSGSVMSGVQILRNTVLFFEVQLVEGVEPLLIPRTQVERVVFDDFDPTRERLRKALFPPTEEVSLASGERVSRYLMEKLRAPVSDGVLSYEKKDLVEILQEIAERMQVNLEIDPSIEKKQKTQRLWDLNTGPETTLMSLLREDLVSQFKFAEVLFEYDTIFVLTKEAAKKRKAENGQ